MARLVRLTGTGPMKLEPQEKPTFVCTCGLSKKFPLCDGSHKKCHDETEGATFIYDDQGQRREA